MVAASRYAASEPDDTGSICPASCGGPNMNPQTTSSAARMKPATTWKAWGGIIDGPHSRQGARPEQREADGGDRKPAPQADSRESEGCRCGDDQRDRRRAPSKSGLPDETRIRSREGGDQAEPGQRRAVQQRGGEGTERDQPEQDEGGCGREEVVQRVTGIDRRERHHGAGGGEDRGNVGDRQRRASPRGFPCAGSIRRPPVAPMRTDRRAARARRGRSGPLRWKSAPGSRPPSASVRPPIQTTQRVPMPYSSRPALGRRRWRWQRARRLALSGSTACSVHGRVLAL